MLPRHTPTRLRYQSTHSVDAAMEGGFPSQAPDARDQWAILHAIPLTGGDDDQVAVSGRVPVIGGKCRVFTERAVFRKPPQGLPTGGGG
jgi:hypothetical protein